MTEKDWRKKMAKSKLLTVNGETHFVTEWAILKNVSTRTINRRVAEGITGEDIFKTTRNYKKHDKTAKEEYRNIESQSAADSRRRALIKKLWGKWVWKGDLK